jgi:hypothetical protein
LSGGTIFLRFLAGLLIVAGAAIAGLAGACSWVLTGASVAGGHVPQGGEIALLLVFGGIPIAVGLAMIAGGVVVWRNVGRDAKGPKT